MSRRRIALLLLAAAALAAALVLLLRPAPIGVEVAEVTRGPFLAEVEEDGRTRVRDRYIVSTPVAGRVLRIAVRAGDAVVRDEEVASVLAAPAALLSARARREAEERLGAAEAMLETASALVERAAAQREQAATDAVRARALQAHGATPLQALERAELALRTAERDAVAANRRFHAAEHELAQARAVLERADILGDGPERRPIRAPLSGRVLRLLQESEAVVAAGTPLLELGDPSDLEVIVDVLTTEATGILPGAAVAIEGWGGPALEGRVRQVEPGAFTKISALGVEEQRVWVVIDLVAPRESWGGLGDGYRVDARIVVARIEDAVLVPVGALFRRGPHWTVFVLGSDGRARERQVIIGRRGPQLAELRQGLLPGERVVVYPPSMLRDGGRAAPRV
jgi:HlyD family secretion protein